MQIESLTSATGGDIEQIVALWRESVRATHDFLPEEMADGLLKPVRRFVSLVEKLCVTRDESGEITAFLGANGGSVDMLFVAPAHFGKGLGTALMSHAIGELGCTKVDVNEQNPRAREFYEKLGFAVASRSELDGQGNPYPILHMELLHVEKT